MKRLNNPGTGVVFTKILLFLFFFFPAYAIQAQKISGSVSDETGARLSKVSVAINGFSAGAFSNDDGIFTIAANPGATLVFSYVGFKPREVKVVGTEFLNVVMEASQESRGLSEVVVTALGIRKDARKLGYAATTVNPDQLTINRTTNPINALQGKVAGLNISTLGTGPGSTSLR